MGNGKKQKQMKNLRRCAYSHKVISQNEEVILTDKALEYVKKMGYKVIPLEKVIAINIFTTIFLTLGGLLLL